MGSPRHQPPSSSTQRVQNGLCSPPGLRFAASLSMLFDWKCCELCSVAVLQTKMCEQDSLGRGLMVTVVSGQGLDLLILGGLF